MKKFSGANKYIESKRKKNTILNILRMKIFWVSLSLMAGMILLIAAAEVFIPHNHDSAVNELREIKSTPEVERDVKRISSKFKCACGECSGETLTICKCKYAVNERNMIRELIKNRTKDEEIIKTINDRFGGIKRVSEL